jgi:hypothetical protein
MKISRIIIGVCIIILIFGGIAVSKSLGLWEVTNSKVPSKIENGEFAGENDPWDIRGSYTFGDIEKAFDIDSTLIAKAFGVESSNPASVQVKTLESLYAEKNYPVEIGTKSVRFFVALYKGLPIEDENIGITTQALDILKDNAKISDQQYNSLLQTSINLNADSLENIQTDDNKNLAKETEQVEVQEEEHRSSTEVTGSTTIEQALAMGIDEDLLKDQIGDISKRDKTEIIRDIAKSQGLSFGEIKSILNDSISTGSPTPNADTSNTD